MFVNRVLQRRQYKVNSPMETKKSIEPPAKVVTPAQAGVQI